MAADMKAVNLEDALKKKPFTPFELHVDNGAGLVIGHPECLMFNQSKTTAVIADGEHFHLIDLEHISSLSYKRRANTGKR